MTAFTGVVQGVILAIAVSQAGAAWAQPQSTFERSEARLAARAARAFESDNERMARGLVTRALRRGVTPEAIKAAETLLTRFPNAGDADLLLSRLVESTEAHDAATARAIARAHFVREELDAADALLARRAQPQDALALALLRELAATHVRRGEFERAQTTLELARRVMPQDRTSLFELVAVLIARGAPDRALPLLLGRLQLQTHDDEARRRLAFVFHAVGRSNDAIAELLQLAQPLDVCAASRIALESGDLARAEALARRAAGVSTAPSEEAAAQRALGLALVRAGERRDAVRALRRSLELEPSVEAQSALDELEPPPPESPQAPDS